MEPGSEKDAKKCEQNVRIKSTEIISLCNILLHYTIALHYYIAIYYCFYSFRFATNNL